MRPLISWFTPQTTAMARTRPSQGQEPKVSPGFLKSGTNPQAVGTSCVAFPGHYQQARSEVEQLGTHNSAHIMYQCLKTVASPAMPHVDLKSLHFLRPFLHDHDSVNSFNKYLLNICCVSGTILYTVLQFEQNLVDQTHAAVSISKSYIKS